MYKTQEMRNSIDGVLQQFAFAELQSENAFMRARACWLYGRYGQFPLDQDHLRNVLDSMYQNMQHNDLPVRVNAAVALTEFLSHDTAVEFVRPGLETILSIFLKIMDDIDFENLIEALRLLVEVFADEVGPHALRLCDKLATAFIRLLHSSNPDDSTEEINETVLNASGMITAIRRILNSISGKYKDLYPSLEQILEQTIAMTFEHKGKAHTEEGLHILAELLYNSDVISERYWNFYEIIVMDLLQNNDIISEFIDSATVPLFNYMNKQPEQFKSMNFQSGNAL